MKSRFNKFTAWLLTLAMLMTFISSFTFTVFAADGDVASVTTADGATTDYYTDINVAIRAAQNSEGSTLKLLDDIDIGDTDFHVYGGKFTIDLNSKNLISSGNAFWFYGSDVIITDNSTEGVGKIVSAGVPINLDNRTNTKLEIAGGTIESKSTISVVNTSTNGETSNAEFILSGGKLVIDHWSAIKIDCRSVTIKGGEIESLGDDHEYQSGLLDFSQHPDPTGFSVFFWLSLKPRTPESIRVNLPAGYCLYEYESGNVASKLEHGLTYTVGRVVEGNEPVCICPNECSQYGLNGSCNACLSDMSDCVGEESEPVQNITLFFNNTQNWSEVYAYYWGSKKITPWPGVPMTHVGDSIWSVSVPADAVNIDIFDIVDYDDNPALTIPTDGRNYYNGGTWTTYVCSHEKYNNGICSVCGEEHSPHTLEDGVCTVCGYVLENTIVEYDKDTQSATVTVKEAGTYLLIFAKYGENNRLDKIDIVEFTFEKGINTVPQKLKEDFTLGTGDKIMLWKDMTNLVPLCEAYIVK